MTQLIKRKVNSSEPRMLNLKSVGKNSQGVLTMVFEDEYLEQVLINLNGSERRKLEDFIKNE